MSNLELDVVIEARSDGSFFAEYPPLSVSASGPTEAVALDKLRDELRVRLKSAHVVRLKVEVPHHGWANSPWNDIIGMDKDHPEFDEWVETMKQIRAERDRE